MSSFLTTSDMLVQNVDDDPDNLDPVNCYRLQIMNAERTRLGTASSHIKAVTSDEDHTTVPSPPPFAKMQRPFRAEHACFCGHSARLIRGPDILFKVSLFRPSFTLYIAGK
jgi:hypothetical protein